MLEGLDAGAVITLRDAVRLMIILSDNTATNLVVDRLGSAHEERLAYVNDMMKSVGLKNTRLLNRLYSWKTKQQEPGRHPLRHRCVDAGGYGHVVPKRSTGGHW